MCVQVCPTGIDIRDGLQLECVNCTQCIDACNDVMVKVGKPEGLIRYARQNQLVPNKSVGLRYRLLIYPLIMLILVSVVVVLLLRRQPASIEQVRIIGGNFTTAVDGIHTPIRLMIENYTEEARTFAITGTNNVRIEKETTLLVPALDAATIDLTVVCAPDTFGRGSRSGVLVINGPANFSQSVSISIAGPFNAHNPIGNANKIKKGE
jgi:polyferredoxin